MKIFSFANSLCLLTLALAVSLCGGNLSSLHAADHREAPKVDAIGEGDLTDVFAFVDPVDATRIVFVLSVNPFAPPSSSSTYSFSPDLLYQIKIDNTGDAREDQVLQFVFSGLGQKQTVSIYGPAAPVSTGARNQLLTSAPTASGAFNKVFGSPTGVLGFAGVRDDPFVFDIGQFFRILNGSQDLFRQVGTSFRGRPVRPDGTSGVDAFGGFNLTSLVVSVPKAMVRGATSKINVWGTVSAPVPPRRSPRTWVQFEREGQQAFATVFVPGGAPRDLFNEEIPEHDVANYSSLVPDALTTSDNDGTGNTIAGRAALLTALGLTTLPNGAPLLLPSTFVNTDKDLLRKALLPDVMRLDLDLPSSAQAIGQFGLQNGRKLADSAIDIPLQILRQLADVHFPTGVTGGGAVGTRAAFECSAFPNCQDRRVLVVVQGTNWVKPDSKVLDMTDSGNDRPYLPTFPYAPAPQPIAGDPGTTGFPPQQ